MYQKEDVSKKELNILIAAKNIEGFTIRSQNLLKLCKLIKEKQDSSQTGQAFGIEFGFEKPQVLYFESAEERQNMLELLKTVLFNFIKDNRKQKFKLLKPRLLQIQNIKKR